MAEPNASPTEVAAPAVTKGSMLTRLCLLATILVVITTECLVAYLFIPNTSQTEVLAAAVVKEAPPAKEEHKEHKQSKGHKAAGAEDAKHDSNDLVEVDLGEFTVTASQPTSNSTLRIAFHLYGGVSALQHGEFEAKMKENQHRYREQVLVTLRGASVNDLTDAGLGLLKRTILEKTNALLGKPLLKMVIFSEFSFYEM